MRTPKTWAWTCLFLAMGLPSALLAQTPSGGVGDGGSAAERALVADRNPTGDGGPRTADSSKRQEEKQPVPALQEEPLPRELRLEEEGGGFLDLDWLEMQPRVGMAIFSDNYKIDPSPHVSVLFHAPMPWLSPPSDPGGEYFGAFLEVTFIPSVERDLDPPPSHTSGSLLFVGAGIDFTLVRNQSLFWVLRAGGQYGSYGGIADLDDGVAPFVGMNAGVYAGGGITLALAPEMIFTDEGESIFLASLGMVIEF